MLFEGPEKKLEIVFNEKLGQSLRSQPLPFWEKVVEKARAKVISSISNEHCIAFLLSESSLFVFDDKLILITCGTTTLVEAAQFVVDHFSPEKVDSLFYQRKNENFPHYQKTNFFDDIKVLNTLTPGKAYQFGEEDTHHMYLFYAGGKSKDDLVTAEVLMHGLSEEKKDCFYKHKLTQEAVEASGMRALFPGFQIDDYIFDPCGYSLNALKEDRYYTIHVTPQERGAYVSFETNAVNQNELDECVSRVLEIFQPETFDIIRFADASSKAEGCGISDGYDRRRHVFCDLVGEDGEPNYSVNFFHYFKPQQEPIAAYEILGDNENGQ